MRQASSEDRGQQRGPGSREPWHSGLAASSDVSETTPPAYLSLWKSEEGGPWRKCQTGAQGVSGTKACLCISVHFHQHSPSAYHGASSESGAMRKKRMQPRAAFKELAMLLE